MHILQQIACHVEQEAHEPGASHAAMLIKCVACLYAAWGLLLVGNKLSHTCNVNYFHGSVFSSQLLQ